MGTDGIYDEGYFGILKLVIMIVVIQQLQHHHIYHQQVDYDMKKK